MSIRVRITDAFLVHVRPYRENDYWCDLLTQNSGRVRCLMSQEHPEYFRLFQLKLIASGDAYRASGFRYVGSPLLTDSDVLLHGMYVNELCYRVLPRDIDYEDFLPAYATVLAQLQFGKHNQRSLRLFEQAVLSVLGLTIDYRSDTEGRLIQANKSYEFEPNQGFRCEATGAISGSELLALGCSDFSQSRVLSVARYVQQQQLLSALDNKPLNSSSWHLGRTGGTKV